MWPLLQLLLELSSVRISTWRTRSREVSRLLRTFSWKMSPVLLVRSVSRETLAAQWSDCLSTGSCVCILHPLQPPWWMKPLNLVETTSRVSAWGLQIHTPSNMERNVPSIVIYLQHSFVFPASDPVNGGLWPHPTSPKASGQGRSHWREPLVSKRFVNQRAAGF
jgi:hypothetical protein